MAKATLGGGCFWCLVKPFDQWDGINSVISGYSNGEVENPTYAQVSTGTTGHIEVVQIDFDEDVISYEEVLEIFFKTFDPTDTGGQFGDRGSQYMPAVLYHDEPQKETAERVIEALDSSNVFDKPINTPVLPFKSFYEAEEEHQDFYKKNRGHYNAYYKGSGRKAFLENHWSESK
ncbi:peptide-methionine (S)-S-oxide reductase MsrA [Lacicoccus alkaliphilus]|uniref:Peptide methionine sulfoxide reductase MsrA n=1 Tax=Lacicoccus alkaliphilus DSM 16010 TaxID=1123231 RepID=A0A1M7B5I5_9BACL|nr:peptide-methionine (S)-S-oxide reductase MsrA [Salinicoccus alkaliphilus]SHL50250.1 peptide-methionine (S)-S-oxide reductase [Salinicoccus alkaliphilus DSM 16010]